MVEELGVRIAGGCPAIRSSGGEVGFGWDEVASRDWSSPEHRRRRTLVKAHVQMGIAMFCWQFPEAHSRLEPHAVPVRPRQTPDVLLGHIADGNWVQVVGIMERHVPLERQKPSPWQANAEPNLTMH
jgi:hypothetical protein